jgi:hypothetical protein
MAAPEMQPFDEATLVANCRPYLVLIRQANAAVEIYWVKAQEEMLPMDTLSGGPVEWRMPLRSVDFMRR